jgi:hypothetical protein
MCKSRHLPRKPKSLRRRRSARVLLLRQEVKVRKVMLKPKVMEILKPNPRRLKKKRMSLRRKSRMT